MLSPSSSMGLQHSFVRGGFGLLKILKSAFSQTNRNMSPSSNPICIQSLKEPKDPAPDTGVRIEPETSQKITVCPDMGRTFSAVAILMAVSKASLYRSRSSQVGRLTGRMIFLGLFPFGAYPRRGFFLAGSGGIQEGSSCRRCSSSS